MLQVKVHSRPGQAGTWNTRTDMPCKHGLKHQNCICWAALRQQGTLPARTAGRRKHQPAQEQGWGKYWAHTGVAKGSLQAPSCSTPASQTPWLPCFCENQEQWHSIRKMSLQLLIKGNFLSHPFSLATLKYSSNDPVTSRQHVSLLTKNLCISTVYCSNHKKLY